MKNRVFSLILALALMGTLFTASPVSAAEAVNVTDLYKTKDTDSSWSVTSATQIDLNAMDGASLTLNEAGDYVLSGSQGKT